jgi:hypothetical protein
MKQQRILGLGAITTVLVPFGAILLGTPADTRPSGRERHRHEDASGNPFHQPENSRPKSKRIRQPREMTDGGRLAAANEAVRTDPVEALAIAAQLPPSAECNDLLVRAAAEWALSEPEQAAAWARQESDQTLRQRLLAAIATHWSERAPVAAANLALEIPAGKQQSDAIVGIVQRWVQTDPQAAATWVASFLEGELREASMENVVKIWARQDSQAIIPWLDTLVEGPSRDTALRAYHELQQLIRHMPPNQFGNPRSQAAIPSNHGSPDASLKPSKP